MIQAVLQVMKPAHEIEIVLSALYAIHAEEFIQELKLILQHQVRGKQCMAMPVERAQCAISHMRKHTAEIFCRELLELKVTTFPRITVEFQDVGQHIINIRALFDADMAGALEFSPHILACVAAQAAQILVDSCKINIQVCRSHAGDSRESLCGLIPQRSMLRRD